MARRGTSGSGGSRRDNEGRAAPTHRRAASGSIEPIEIQEEMERSFLEYSMSVIVSRALPDVRDGLKPVHRRILYSMYDRAASARPAPHASAPRSSATSWVLTTPTATRPSTTPWSAWSRTSRCATR